MRDQMLQRARWRRFAAFPTIAAGLALVAMSVPADASGAAAAPRTGRAVADRPDQTDRDHHRHDWPSAGYDLADTHFNPDEHRIKPANVAGLAPRWTFTTGGSVSATPTIVDGSVYVPDWGGNLNAVDARTGQAKWTKKISDYTGEPGDISRVSPAYWDGEIVTGDGVGGRPVTLGADVFAVDARTGAKRWLTQVDSDPLAVITASPVITDGVVYVGVSSRAETAPPGTTFTFRGSMVALDAATGHVLWKTYTLPEGYNGAAIWGSSPVVDRETGLVYAGTGNFYDTPPGICVTPDETGCTMPEPAAHIDSVLAFDMHTGALAWSRPTLTADTWTLAKRYGPDFDFGCAPNLFTTTVAGKKTTLLGIGQKSGVYWALDPRTGAIVWATVVGAGGTLGGIQWGTATDGNRIYVAIADNHGDPYTLQGEGPYAGQTVTAGSWSALDAATGKILWQTPDPQPTKIDQSSLTVANGLLYAGSMAATGPDMYALDAATGLVKWSFASGGAVISSPAVVDGTVYWGSGYHTQTFPPPLGYYGENNKLYAFSLPEDEDDQD